MKALFASVLALLVLSPIVGCAPGGEIETLDEADQDEEALSAVSRTFVAIRRDFRKCMSPYCGGYWVHDVNRKHLSEKYVSALDFSASGLDDATIGQVIYGDATEVVLYGKLGPKDPATSTRTFLVSDAYRGMPGRGPAQGDLFYDVTEENIQCFAAPCDTLRARKLNSTQITAFSGTDAELGSNISGAWLARSVAARGAIVAGGFRDGESFPAGTETILDASQVYLHLPEGTGPCPKSPEPLCEDPTVSAYTYTADRCVVFSECVEGGACIALAPMCDEGYTPVSWPSAPFGCYAHACEPSFLHSEETK